MSNRKKTMLMLFGDYLFCLVLQLIAMVAFYKILDYSWGVYLYTVFFSVLLFTGIYRRTWLAAKRDSHLKENRPGLSEGLILVLPLALFNLLIAALYGLIQANIIPIRDIVINTVYTFPDNAPRVAREVLLLDKITPWVRTWFSSLLAFMQGKTPAAVLFIVPALNLLAGALGYIAGIKKFFFSEHMLAAKEKVKEKFNE
ncbi:MAG: hypothetical protein IJF61_04090 [Clostridia bacterium]|nr:hypothetical protein [Clostridia bacterium]